MRKIRRLEMAKKREARRLKTSKAAKKANAKLLQMQSISK
ncbi:Uncharacterised protein [Mesomycoplasma conjunctivae]|uniref:Uncharacterized protein n=1 Tax=Mesomycoplasma conjunctivae (strain ATCC 25834 / NCTC 10147 / HRC/581) TaxID=572263 RepID=C5J702_MESCH|nr:HYPOTHETICAL PROTEIN MCJ_005660 [Mesomycoplasma conjunctivae]VEU66495.1 Uncharacterised protein [Mesomycoplasma conjunctivae]